jgi:hypothetical protein
VRCVALRRRAVVLRCCCCCAAAAVVGAWPPIAHCLPGLPHPPRVYCPPARLPAPSAGWLARAGWRSCALSSLHPRHPHAAAPEDASRLARGGSVGSAALRPSATTLLEKSLPSRAVIRAIRLRKRNSSQSNLSPLLSSPGNHSASLRTPVAIAAIILAEFLGPSGPAPSPAPSPHPHRGPAADRTRCHWLLVGAAPLSSPSQPVVTLQTLLCPRHRPRQRWIKLSRSLIVSALNSSCRSSLRPLPASRVTQPASTHSTRPLLGRKLSISMHHSPLRHAH